jgi:hypothetical protein
MKEKEDYEQREESPTENHINGSNIDSLKLKLEESKPNESPSHCISQFLSSIMNLRRDEMTLSLNNFLSGGNQAPVATNLLLNDLNRSFLSGNFNNDHMNPALISFVANHQQYSKFGRGTCKWPGCDMVFDDLQTFTK